MKILQQLSTNRKLLSLIIALSSIVGANHFAAAATVRGRLVNSKYEPVPGIQVATLTKNNNQSVPTTSDGNGMFSFNVPAGNYTLEVWAKPGQAPLRFEIQVHDPYTDLAPVTIN
jgi:Carboxypeptidase regulatory-like domain